MGGASASTGTSTYQRGEVWTRNSVSEVGGGDGGPSSAQWASDDSQSSTPPPPPPPDGSDNEEDHGPKTFSEEIGVEVEVPAAVTQRIAGYKCERGYRVSSWASRFFLHIVFFRCWSGPQRDRAGWTCACWRCWYAHPYSLCVSSLRTAKSPCTIICFPCPQRHSPRALLIDFLG